MPGAIQTRSGITLAQAKAHLCETASTYDTHLDLFLEAALEEADTYCNNPFVDEDGAELPIPARIKLGVLSLVETKFDRLKSRQEADPHLEVEGDDKGTIVPLRAGQTIASITRDLKDGTKETTSFRSPSQSVRGGARVLSEKEIKRQYFAPYRMTPGF